MVPTPLARNRLADYTEPSAIFRGFMRLDRPPLRPRHPPCSRQGTALSAIVVMLMTPTALDARVGGGTDRHRGHGNQWRHGVLQKGAHGDGYERERIFVGAAAMGPDELVQPNGRIDATWLRWITEI